MTSQREPERGPERAEDDALAVRYWKLEAAVAQWFFR